MLRNYLKITFRNLRKNKAYLIINTLGLGVSLACCVTAYLLLAYNLEFDSSMPDEAVEDVFVVHTHVDYADGNSGHHLVTPINLGPAMANNIAGITDFTRWNGDRGAIRYGDKVFNEGVIFADPSFYEIFPFQVLEGSLESFKDPSTVVISREIAEKYFPDESSIGKVLTANFANETEINVQVGAVIEKYPLNSTLVFDMMMRIEHFYDIHNLNSATWNGWRDPALFLKVEDPANAENIGKLTKPYMDIRNEAREDLVVTSYQLQPFKSNFNQDEINWTQTNIRISTVPLIVFSIMALMILMVACFNLANTSFAIAARRLKEVGVRKVIGATRMHIIGQFILEMIVTIIFAMIVGLVISRFIVREFADMWNLQYGLEDLNGLNLVILMIGLVFITAILAGLYPAMFNSKFQPAIILKGGAKIKGTNFFTRTLVGVQFVISVIVMINGIIFIQNTRFQESVNYGFDIEDVLTVDILNKGDYDILKGTVASLPQVEMTGATHHTLSWSSYPFPVKVDTSEYQVQHIETGENFFEIMGLQLVSGRFIDMTRTNDELGAIVVNQRFLEETGIKDPLNAIVTVREDRRRIVGVVENHVDNLFRAREPEPFVFYPAKRHEYRMMLVKANTTSLRGLQDAIEEQWKEQFPNRPFVSRLQDDLTFQGIRQTNNNLKKIFIFLTILGGLLSASGIFALASLNVEKRTKEIGIRKALGASIQNMVMLLSKEFSIILVIAAIIGAVGGYFLSSQLLGEIYAYHISVGPIPLLAGAIVLIIVGLLTCGSTVYNAAIANPVKSLRDE